MSKYHKGDKFIVEIKEVMNSDNGTLYRSNFKTLTFDDYGLDKLQKYEQPTISKDTLEMERMKALNDGRNEVWELAKKLWHNDVRTNDDIYGIEYFIDIANEYTAQEALAKLEAYEKKIEVGDVVERKETNTKGVVIRKNDDDYCHILFGDGSAGKHQIKNFKKTGKHIDIQSVLEQIGGGSDA